MVVVVYNIPREGPRTLTSLSTTYQRGIEPDDYEIIVVDNGSDPPFDHRIIEGLSGHFRLIRLDPAPPSPALAVNRGLREARGEVVGVMIDGARIATPGLLHFARHAAHLYPTTVVAVLGWYLGHDYQRRAMRGGYDHAREDALLASIDWPRDGYRLFEIGTMDESSHDGWLEPISESNALFLRRDLWASLGGADEQFSAPGGGLLNLDLFRRAVEWPGAELVLLLGEGTFHQLHGGVATNSSPKQLQDDWIRWSAEYEAIRGQPYAIPLPNRAPTYLGVLPRPALARFVRAAIDPFPRPGEPALGRQFDPGIWSLTPPARPKDPTIAGLVRLAQDEFRGRRYASAAAVAQLIRERDSDEPEAQRILALTAAWLPWEGPPEVGREDYHLALAKAHRLLGENDLARTHRRAARSRLQRQFKKGWRVWLKVLKARVRK